MDILIDQVVQYLPGAVTDFRMLVGFSFHKNNQGFQDSRVQGVEGQ